MAIQITTLIMSFIYLLMIIIMFSSKEKVNNSDTKIYHKLQIISLTSVILEITLYCLTITIYGKSSMLNQVFLITSKVFVCVICTWFFEMLQYAKTIYIKRKSLKNSDLKNTIYKIVFSFICILIIASPVEFVLKENQGYTSGLATKLAFLTILIICVIMIYYIIRLRKNLRNKEFVPILLSIAALLLTTIIQSINPALLLFNPSIVFVTVIMYHTIENPDMKMIEQLKNTYVMNDKINKDREYFSFKMAQEMRQATSLMSKINDDILENKTNPEVIEEDVGYTKEVNRDLQVITNNILDISAMDSAKLRVINQDYNVQYLFDEINLYCKNEVPENIEFRSSFSENIPSRLYGDGIRLKQIIYTILDNSIKHTKKGFIELDVQCIIKYDVCRLIMTMEDSGVGMDLKQVNELLESEKELSEESIEMLDSKNMNLKLVKKLVHFIGGVINISSTPDRGTKTRIIIDQKIPEESINKDNKFIDKYKVMLNDKKKIVIITEEDNIKNQLQKFIPNNEYDLRFLDLSKTCLDIVRNGEEMDLILVQEDMSKIDAYELLQKLKMERNFNGNVIIIAKNMTVEKRSDLLHAGFREVVSLPIDRSSLNDKIELLLQQKRKR